MAWRRPSSGRPERLLVSFQRGEEGGGAGEEPLLQRLQHELGGEPLGVVFGPLGSELRVLASVRRGFPLLVGVRDFDGFEDTGREPGRAVPFLGEVGSVFRRRTMTASSCLRSGSVPRENRWLSSSSSRALKLSR
jgi:hypothetical protein